MMFTQMTKTNQIKTYFHYMCFVITNVQLQPQYVMNMDTSDRSHKQGKEMPQTDITTPKQMTETKKSTMHYTAQN